MAEVSVGEAAYVRVRAWAAVHNGRLRLAMDFGTVIASKTGEFRILGDAETKRLFTERLNAAFEAVGVTGLVKVGS